MENCSNGFKKFNPIKKLDSLKEVITSRMKNSSKLVYAYLVCCFHSQRGQCNPSQETMSKELGISVRTIQRSIKELRQLGIINWTSGNPIVGSNRYYLAHSSVGLFIQEDTTNEVIEDDKVVPLHTTPVAHKTMKETMNKTMNKTNQNEPEPYGGSGSSGSSVNEDNYEANKEAFYKHFKKLGVFNVN